MRLKIGDMISGVDGVSDDGSISVFIRILRRDPSTPGIMVVVDDGEYRIAPIGQPADCIHKRLCIEAIWRMKHGYEDDYEKLCDDARSSADVTEGGDS